MEAAMRIGCFDARHFDWRSLTPAQRAALPMILARQAREERARDIGTALLRRGTRLRDVLWRACGFAAARSVTRRWASNCISADRA